MGSVKDLVVLKKPEDGKTGIGCSSLTATRSLTPDILSEIREGLRF